ncbi:MAG: hypothetical protein JKY42_10265 [Flavobacteriales bacterium]|nr:hypothetical protein [Flavobacteriales bacterium]
MSKFFKLDSWFTGIAVGLLIPAVIYFGGRAILEWQEKFLGAEFNESFSLFAFAINGGIVYFFMNKRGRDRFGKGIIAATFVYVFIWVFKYQV